jgi:hypothetical protein
MMQDAGYWMLDEKLDTGCRMQDTGCWILDPFTPSTPILDTGCKIQDTG